MFSVGRSLRAALTRSTITLGPFSNISNLLDRLERLPPPPSCNTQSLMTLVLSKAFEEEQFSVQHGPTRKLLYYTDKRIYPKKSKSLNLAFDVTPAKLVTGLITEKGVCEASEKGLKGLFK